MSLKGKLAALATVKIAEKAMSNGIVDSTINTAISKLSKLSGLQSTTDYVQQSNSNCLIIKAKSYSLGTIAGLLSGKQPNMNDYLGRYQIVDPHGELLYTSESEHAITSRDVLDVYDPEGFKIGYIKEHFVSFGVPLLEKDARRCSVFFGTEKIAEIKKSISFGELDYEVLEGSVEIHYSKGKHINILYKGKIIATLHDIPVRLADDYVDKYVMEYNDISNESIAIMLAIAIDFIRSS